VYKFLPVKMRNLTFQFVILFLFKQAPSSHKSGASFQLSSVPDLFKCAEPSAIPKQHVQKQQYHCLSVLVALSQSACFFVLIILHQ